MNLNLHVTGPWKPIVQYKPRNIYGLLYDIGEGKVESSSCLPETCWNLRTWVQIVSYKWDLLECEKQDAFHLC